MIQSCYVQRFQMDGAEPKINAQQIDPSALRPRRAYQVRALNVCKIQIVPVSIVSHQEIAQKSV